MISVQWHPARAEVGFTLAGARAFNDVYSIDLTRGRVERWTFSEMGGANPDAARRRDREVEKLRRPRDLRVFSIVPRPASRARAR